MDAQKQHSLSVWRSFKLEFSTSRQRIAYALGLGLVLFSIHNIRQPGIEYITLPILGTIILIFSIWFSYLRGTWTFGPKRIWIPLAIISVSIIVAGVRELSYHGVGTALMGAVLFSVYLACRWLGKDVFKVFLIAIGVECIFVFHQAIAHPGIRTGGMFGGALDREWTNYAMALRLLVFGTLAGMAIISPKYRWWLLIPVGLALFLTGAEETLLVGGIIFVAMVVREDLSKRLLVVPAFLAVALILTLPTGIPQQLYGQFATRVDALNEGSEGLNEASGHRLTVYADVINNLSIVGHGYYVTEFGDVTKTVPHNVPLIITNQIGPIAALAWIFVMVLMAVYTKWRYLFIGILAMAILDHALWTQAAPWWWAAVGVASNDNPVMGTDRIFSYANS